MDDAEKKEYMENENCFIGILEDWCSRNEGVELTFFGQPDNLLDKTILDRCPTILLDGRTATATNELTTLMTRNWIAGYAGRSPTVRPRRTPWQPGPARPRRVR